MKRNLGWFVPVLAVVVLGACGGRHSPIGFRLPEGGDSERGMAVFIEQECYRCHTVAGVAVPKSTGELPQPVPLGGVVREVRTDGYLVTAIINPSHDLTAYPQAKLAGTEGVSPMPDHNRDLTVRQLVDLIAFLQSRYHVEPPPPTY